MKELAQEGMTMLVVTHELKFARNVASKIVFMADGSIVEEASPQAFSNIRNRNEHEDFAANY